MHEYAVAGKGLHTMYVGETVSLVSLPVLLFVPPLGLIGAAVGGIMALVGLEQAGPAHDKYKTAMMLVLVGLLISLIESFVGDGPVASALNLIGSMISCFEAYYICTASGELLSAKGEHDLAGRAEQLWKVLVGRHAVSVVCVLIAWIPIINIFADTAVIIAAIVSIAVALMMIGFYHNASKALLNE